MSAEFDKVAESCQKNVDNLKKATDQLAQQQQQQIEEALKKQAEMNQRFQDFAQEQKTYFPEVQQNPFVTTPLKSLPRISLRSPSN